MAIYLNVMVSSDEVAEQICTDFALFSEIFNAVADRVKGRAISQSTLDEFVEELDNDGLGLFAQLAAAVAARGDL